MQIPERVTLPSSKISTAFGVRSAENFAESGCFIKGEVFLEVKDSKTGQILDKWHKNNLVVLDASIILARLAKDNAEPPKGIFALAVGTGDIGWNPMSPPAPTNTQRALYAEITRKTFTTTQFIDANGAPVAYPTHVVDFTTTFTESEAVGPLVEMGLIGGNISSNLSIKNPVSPPNGTYDPTLNLTTKETLWNYLSFAVVNKAATSSLTITWRLSF